MATYYVAAAGSDSNPGTQAQPFATLSHAQAVASDGDTILLNRGDTFTVGSAVTFTVGVTIGAYGSGAPPAYRTSTYEIALIKFLNVDGWTVQDLSLTAPMPTVAVSTTNRNICPIYCETNDGTTRSRPITVQRCTVTGGRNGIGFNGQGIQITRTNNITVQYNTVSGCQWEGIAVAFPNPGVVAWGPGWYSNCLIQWNEVYSIGDALTAQGNGIVMAAHDAAVAASVCQHNHIHDIGVSGTISGWGFYCLYSTDLVLQYNAAHDFGAASGSESAAYDLDSNSTGILFQNNDAWNGDGPGIEYYPNASQYSGNIIRGNRLYNFGRTLGTSSPYCGAMCITNIAGSGTVSLGPGGVSICGNTAISLTSGTPGFASSRNNGGYIYNIDAYDNLFQAPSGTPAAYFNGAFSGCSLSNNSYYSPGGTPSFFYNGSSYSSLAAWQAATGQDAGSTSLSSYSGLPPGAGGIPGPGLAGAGRYLVQSDGTGFASSLIGGRIR